MPDISANGAFPSSPYTAAAIARLERLKLTLTTAVRSAPSTGLPRREDILIELELLLTDIMELVYAAHVSQHSVRLLSHRLQTAQAEIDELRVIAIDDFHEREKYRRDLRDDGQRGAENGALYSLELEEKTRIIATLTSGYDEQKHLCRTLRDTVLDLESQLNTALLASAVADDTRRTCDGLRAHLESSHAALAVCRVERLMEAEKGSRLQIAVAMESALTKVLYQELYNRTTLERDCAISEIDDLRRRLIAYDEQPPFGSAIDELQSEILLRSCDVASLRKQLSFDRCARSQADVWYEEARARAQLIDMFVWSLCDTLHACSVRSNAHSGRPRLVERSMSTDEGLSNTEERNPLPAGDRLDEHEASGLRQSLWEMEQLVCAMELEKRNAVLAAEQKLAAMRSVVTDANDRIADLVAALAVAKDEVHATRDESMRQVAANGKSQQQLIASLRYALWKAEERCLKLEEGQARLVLDHEWQLYVVRRDVRSP